METIYGESSEIQTNDTYSSGGGISLFSAGDDGETIVGGSGDQGSNPTSARIYWEMTRTPNGSGGYTYSGGISNVSWYTEVPTSPFAVPPYNDPAKLWEIASGTGSLNEVFDAWNEDQGDAGTEKRAHFLYFISQNAKGCSSNSVG